MPTQVKATWVENIAFKVNVKDFPEFIMDEPKSFHGNDLGPSAGEFLLVSIAGCQGVSFMFCLQKFGIEVEEIVVNVESKMAHVFREKYEREILNIVKIDVVIDVKLKDPEDEEDLLECFEVYRKYCVVTTSVEHGIPYEVKLNHSY
ncbi:MAG: OsmC family protein [Candidatus Helarchaeota archaeon]|nr:OsmC family protein [Candidatus Helarchaeota archaeon]